VSRLGRAVAVMAARGGRAPLQAADVALGVVIGAAAAIVGGGAAVVELAAVLGGHGAIRLSVQGVAHGVIGWHRHAGNPRLAFPAALRAALPGPVLMYVAVGIVALALVGLGALFLALYARRPSARERDKAERRERGLASPRKLARAFPAGPGRLVVGRTLQGAKTVTLPTELSLGAIMGPRTGKSSSAVGHVLDAPGPVLATSSKPELLLATALGREERSGQASLAYDPLDICGWPTPVRWNPLSGCESPSVAMRRAEALMAGTSTENVTNGGFWKAAGTMLLRCVLHACALEDGDVAQLRQWVADPRAGDLVDVLGGSPTARAWLHDAELMTRQHGETLESVALTTAVALDCLALPEVAEACSPPPGEGFDPVAWLGSGGTLHVVAPDAEAASVAPLTAAFVDEVVISARRIATARPAGRLEPPLRLVLDELPNICPLPRVVEYISDGGGRGIQIVWYAQSRYQLVRRFGPDGAKVLLDATSAMLFSGGLQDAELLRDLSGMLGQLDVRHRSWGADRSGQASWTEQVREVAVMDSADIFSLGAFEALMLAGGVGGALVRVVPWWERPDAQAIRAATEQAVARTAGKVA
ncbi:MAG: TraM recognition domain-containing protein, partial [Actinomycetota bacterium]|nr:TraM recognition domain-containing protein [Actinomycetota bacterium]